MIREALLAAQAALKESISGDGDRGAWVDCLRSVDEAITAIDAPFDISKFPEWVKEGWRYVYGKYGLVWHEHTKEWSISSDGLLKYSGPIKTQSFFLALCEALNIE